MVGVWHNARELSARICDLDSRRVRRTIQHVAPAGQGETVTTAFSPDAAVMAVARADGTVELWDVRAGRVRTVLGDDNTRFLGFADERLWAPLPANPLAFTSGGKLIAVKYFGDRSPSATGEDSEMRVAVWDVADHFQSPGETIRDASEQSQAEPSAPAKSESPATAPLRTWSSADGRFNTRATLIRADSDTATLETADGRTIQVPLTRLSAADRQYIRDQSR
jgi:WD40 repeat protein